MQFKNAFLPFSIFKTSILFIIIFVGLSSFLLVNIDKNPFTVKNTGLPHHAPGCDLGTLSELDAKTAKEAIEAVFEEANIPLQKNYLIDKDGVKLIVTGYNADLKIGYIWLDYDNLLFGDSYLSDMNFRYYRSNKTQNRKHPALSSFQLFFNNPERFLQHLNKSKTGEKYVERFEKIYTPNQPFSKKDSLTFLNIYIDHSTEFNIGRWRNEKLTQVGKSILATKNTDKKLEQYIRFLDLFSFDYSMRYGSGAVGENALQFAIDQIDKVNVKEWQQLRDKLLILAVYTLRKDLSSETFAEIERSFALPDDERQMYWAEVIDSSDFKTVSMAEVAYLEAAADSLESHFIAPISRFDRRFSYQGYGSRALTKLLSKEKNHKNHPTIIQDFCVKNQQEKLTELQSEVRRYIEWAKGRLQK